MNLLAYILKANLFLVVFYGFYFLFFRKETFHKANRYFLVVGAMLALVLPFVRSSQMQKPEIISTEIRAAAYDLYFQSEEVIVGPVVETYSGNDNIAFSEKIFRALVTPVPWTVYSATGAVEYLKTLGFDVLDDLVDHGYNNVYQDAPHGLQKIKAYINASIDSYNQLKTGNFEQIKARCLQAAQHNQQLLNSLQQQWPLAFANWFPKAVDAII
jgi:hypothetical protein